VTQAIVPRWEWRTFGEDFGDAENFTKLGCDGLIVSDRGLRHGLLVDRFARCALVRLRVSAAWVT
jgi:hypothetical protein